MQVVELWKEVFVLRCPVSRRLGDEDDAVTIDLKCVVARFVSEHHLMTI